jgi:hypothetical protein
MGTRLSVRTTCCESYKVCGERCSVCPNRLENQAILRMQQQSGYSAPVTSGNRSPRPFRSCFRQPDEPSPVFAIVGD